MNFKFFNTLTLIQKNSILDQSNLVKFTDDNSSGTVDRGRSHDDTLLSIVAAMPVIHVIVAFTFTVIQPLS